MITLYFKNGQKAKYTISSEDVEKFVEACMRLHNYPGINPHNKQKTARLEKITRKDLLTDVKNIPNRPWSSGPYWWSTPNLQKNHDPSGVKIWRFYGQAKTSYGEEKDIWSSQAN